MAKTLMRYTWEEDGQVKEVTAHITTLYRVLYEREAARRHWPLANQSPEGALSWCAWRMAKDNGLTVLDYQGFLTVLDDPTPVDEDGNPITPDQDTEDEDAPDPTRTAARSAT